MEKALQIIEKLASWGKYIERATHGIGALTGANVRRAENVLGQAKNVADKANKAYASTGKAISGKVRGSQTTKLEKAMAANKRVMKLEKTVAKAKAGQKKARMGAGLFFGGAATKTILD